MPTRLPEEKAPEPRLRQVRAAQLRAQATRWSLGKAFLGIVFFVGALAHTLGPEPLSFTSGMWTALLLVLSTVNVGLGLRGLSRVRKRGTWLWVVATALYGLAALVMLRLVAAR